jgi:uncharacterized protein (TIGR02996 family)
MTLTSPAAIGLLRAILEDPLDDVPRLLLADVLEEAGDPRGEFIRVQIELARLSRQPCGGYYCDESVGHIDCEDPTGERRDALRQRERELLDEYGFDWFGQFARSAGVDEGRGPDRNAWNFRSLGGTLGWCHFRRGFVASVTLTCADWCGAECRHCNGSGSTRPMTMIGVSQIVTCSACHGTGRTGGHGPALVLAAPIEEVVLSDVLPREVRSATASRWWFVGDTHVPAKLLNLANQSGIGIPPGHTTPQAASAVLSRAALRWARQEAGLPALS